MSRSLAVSHEPADDVERGLLSAAQDVGDVPLLLSRSPSPALPPGGGSPTPLKRPPSSLGSGSDLSIELTMPVPADGRTSRSVFCCVRSLLRQHVVLSWIARKANVVFLTIPVGDSHLHVRSAANRCLRFPTVWSCLVKHNPRSLHNAPCRVRPRTLSPVQSLSDTSERHGPQTSEAAIPKSPSAPLMSPCQPASPFAALCTRPFEPGPTATSPSAAPAMAAQDSTPAVLSDPPRPVLPAQHGRRASRDRLGWRRASVPTSLGYNTADQVCLVANAESGCYSRCHDTSLSRV